MPPLGTSQLRRLPVIVITINRVVDICIHIVERLRGAVVVARQVRAVGTNCLTHVRLRPALRADLHRVIDVALVVGHCGRTRAGVAVNGGCRSRRSHRHLYGSTFHINMICISIINYTVNAVGVEERNHSEGGTVVGAVDCGRHQSCIADLNMRDRILEGVVTGYNGSDCGIVDFDLHAGILHGNIFFTCIILNLRLNNHHGGSIGIRSHRGALLNKGRTCEGIRTRLARNHRKSGAITSQGDGRGHRHRDDNLLFFKVIAHHIVIHHDGATCVCIVNRRGNRFSHALGRVGNHKLGSGGVNQIFVIVVDNRLYLKICGRRSDTGLRIAAWDDGRRTEGRAGRSNLRRVSCHILVLSCHMTVTRGKGAVVFTRRHNVECFAKEAAVVGGLIRALVVADSGR